MNFLNRIFGAIEGWFSRRTTLLRHPRAPFVAAVTMPFMFGLLSLLLGQDDNWDLRNYHHYNAYALLNGRMDIDMAPGQWQSYFNPTPDIPYYLLNSWFPAPVTGFVFGWLHGLNFILVLAIARQLLPRPAEGEHARLPLLLAAAGVLGTGFLSEVGNTMGDNMTSMLVLSSLYIALRYWDALLHWGTRAAIVAVGAGIVMGLGTGLKLTNATYAVALCLAFFAVPVGFWLRLRLAFVFGVGVLAGIAVTAGYWFLTLWQTFGNPIFPQFNNIFRSPLAQQIGVIDLFHLPKNMGEAALWPFVFTADFQRVSELVLKQTIWPVVYVLFIALACYWLFTRFSRTDDRPGLSARARFLLVFFGVAYLAWMKLFGIYRYLIPVELLAPLVVWILLQRIAPAVAAGRCAGWVLAITTLSVFPFKTWGHSPWASQSFSAEVPKLVQPASTIVFTAHGDPPMGWLATFFPKEVAVIALGSGFPESPAYLERISAVVARRPGPHYVMLQAATNQKETSVQRKLKLVQALGLTDSASGCRKLAWLVKRVRFQAQLVSLPGDQCTLELDAAQRIDLAAQNRAVIAAATQNLARYGLLVDGASCTIYRAKVGAEPYPYQFCGVNLHQDGFTLHAAQ